jgi:5-methyltetrahydrofolate corrinoid/iron sulfur protein methyltransferase
MICIGENLNVMSKTLGPAMKSRDAKPLQEMAKAEAEQGVDYIDLNIGPARKDGPELMEFVVKAVQEVVDLPCCLDTTNPDALAAGLKVHKGKPIINSVTLQPDRLQRVMPLAKEYDTDIIALLWGTEGMPRDENERAMLAADMMMKANEIGVKNEQLWIDPIVSPITSADLIPQVKACVAFMPSLQDLVPGCKSTVGLSNVSNGAPDKLRPWLNRTYMLMFMRYGLHSAIVDAFDEDLLAMGRGEKKEVAELVYKVMDGEKMDESSLSDELRNYYRSARVLTGEVYYSDSWLD